jgi:hypothetical protein
MASSCSSVTFFLESAETLAAKEKIMALLAICVWSVFIIGVSMVAMVTQESDPTFAGEGGSYDASWDDLKASSRLSA